MTAAPCIGALVAVERVIDKDVCDMSGYVGTPGIVAGFDPSGPGASEADPMVVVDLLGGVRDAFWPEELGGAL